jgi:hypothetical protein
MFTSSLPDKQVIVLTTFDDDSLRQRAGEAGQPPIIARLDRLVGKPRVTIDSSKESAFPRRGFCGFDLPQERGSQ